MIERRRKQQDQPVGAANELLVHGGHRAGCASWLCGAAEDGPGLGNCVNAAFGVLRGAQRRAVVEISAAVPLAIPAIVFQSSLEAADVQAPRLSTLALATAIRELCKLPQDGVQEPAEPYAFALAVLSHAVHAVVPVTGAHQRQAVTSHIQAAVQGARAVLEKRRAGFRNARLEIGFLL